MGIPSSTWGLIYGPCYELILQCIIHLPQLVFQLITLLENHTAYMLYLFFGIKITMVSASGDQNDDA